MADIRPIDKTVVTDIKVTVADLYVKTRAIKSAFSVKVPRDVPFTQQDVVITPTNGLTIPGFSAFMMIRTYVPIQAVIFDPSSGASFTLTVDKLWVMHGTFDKEIQFTSFDDNVRISCVYA